MLLYYLKDMSLSRRISFIRFHKVNQSFIFFFFFASQEGANINKSLTTLGKVISALAEVVSIIEHYYGVY